MFVDQAFVRFLVGIFDVDLAGGVELVGLEVTLAGQLTVVGTKLDLLDLLKGLRLEYFGLLVLEKCKY